MDTASERIVEEVAQHPESPAELRKTNMSCFQEALVLLDFVFA